MAARARRGGGLSSGMGATDLKALVRNAPFSFVGTMEHVGAATSRDVPIDDRTAVVRVDLVLHALDAFQHLDGQRLTIQLSAEEDPPTEGQQVVFFAEGLAFGETVAVAEIARASVDAVTPLVEGAAEAGTRKPLASLQQEIADDAVREHADSAAAVVVGTVVGLAEAAPPSDSEHDPLWWVATIDVRRVVRGPLEPGRLEVLYPNSLDVMWARAPKPKASQEALWILHETDGETAQFGRFVLLHAEDRQPVTAAATITGEDG